MKTNVLFRTSFWGILLIFLGSLFLVEEFLQIDIPLFTILISCLLIYFGVKLINGNIHAKKMENLNVFGSHTLGYNEELYDYSNIFGESKLDLSNIELKEDKTIEINCIFGDFKVKISNNLNYKIVSNTLFGKTTMLDRSTDGFGSQVYTPSNFSSVLPCLTIKSNVIFGQIEFIMYR
ncbi:MAG: LiaF domain-containing protein [Bacteroidales bacterium]